MFGLKWPSFSTAIGLGGHVALLDRILVGDEGRRVEGVGLHVLLLEAVGRLHPAIEGGEAFLADEGGRLRQILPLVEADAGVRHDDLRVLLEMRGDDDDRHVLLDRVEGEQQVAAHVEIELAGGEQEAVVGLRAARHDRHVEPVFGVGSVDDGLIIAAVLGLGEPVGAERDLVGGDRRRRDKASPAKSNSTRSIICRSPDNARTGPGLATSAPSVAAAAQACVPKRQGRDLSMRRLNPTTIHPPFANYAHGVEVDAEARLVFCSGQLGIAPRRRHPATTSRTRRGCAFARSRRSSPRRGMTLADLVRLNAYVTARRTFGRATCRCATNSSATRRRPRR